MRFTHGVLGIHDKYELCKFKWRGFVEEIAVSEFGQKVVVIKVIKPKAKESRAYYIAKRKQV